MHPRRAARGRSSLEAPSSQSVSQSLSRPAARHEVGPANVRYLTRVNTFPGRDIYRARSRASYTCHQKKKTTTTTTVASFRVHRSNDLILRIVLFLRFNEKEERCASRVLTRNRRVARIGTVARNRIPRFVEDERARARVFRASDRAPDRERTSSTKLGNDKSSFRKLRYDLSKVLLFWLPRGGLTSFRRKATTTTATQTTSTTVSPETNAS